MQEHFLCGCILFLRLQAEMWHLERMDSGRVCDSVASLCFATRGFAMCRLRVVRCDVQVGDRDVKEVRKNRKCVHDCVVEALILRKKRVKTLSLCKSK